MLHAIRRPCRCLYFHLLHLLREYDTENDNDNNDSTMHARMPSTRNNFRLIWMIDSRVSCHTRHIFMTAKTGYLRSKMIEKQQHQAAAAAVAAAAAEHWSFTPITWLM